MKVTIASPVYGGFNPETTKCLLELVANGGYDFHIVIAEDGYTIAENRNYIAVQACNNNSDYVLMIDSDMTFESDLLDRLIANQKDICGVAYHPRAETGQIIKYLDETHCVRLADTDDPKYKQTFECHATGTGIILIKCDVFRKMKRPWFAFEFYDTGQCKKGEDWYFCEKAKEYNIKTFADPTIPVGHIGEVIR